MARSRKTKRKNLPATPKAPARRVASGSWLFWAAMISTALVTFPGMIGGNFLPKSVWATFWIGMGLIFMRSHEDAEGRPQGISPLALLWVAYMAWALVSLIWAPSWRALLMRFGAAMLVPMAAYLLAVHSRFWKYSRSWQFLAVLLITIASIGFLQVAASLILSPEAMRALLRFFPGSNLPRATLGNRNYASMFFAVALPFLFYGYHAAQSRRARILQAAAILCAGLFLLLARTRGAWLGVFMAAMAALVAYASVSDWKSAVRKFLVPGLVLFLLLSIAVSLVPTSVFEGGEKRTVFSTLAHFFEDSGRIRRWTQALDFIELPLGSGYGNFAIHATAMRGEKVLALHTDIHNDYLENLISIGIPGLALFVAFFALALWQAWRGRRDPLVVAAGASVLTLATMQLTTFTMEKVSSQLIAASAIAVINFRSPMAFAWKWPVTHIRKTRLLRPALGLFMLSLTVLAFMNALGDYRIARWMGKEGVHRVYSVATRELNRIAIQVVPTMFYDGNISHLLCHELQKTAIQMKQFEAGERLARRALAMHPSDHVAWSVLAQVAEERGNRAEAIARLEKAAALAHNNPDEAYAQKALRMRIEDNPKNLLQIAKSLEANLREAGKIDNPYSPMMRHLVGIYVHLGGEHAQHGQALWQEASRHILEPFQGNSPLPYEPRRMVAPRPASGEVIGETQPTLRWEGPESVKHYDLYLWPEGALKPEKPLLSGLEASEARCPRPLQPGGVYFWQIKAHGKFVDSTSPLWYFRISPDRAR